MPPARNEFKDKYAQGQSGCRIGFGGAVFISLLILAGIGYGVHTHLEDLKAEKQLQEALVSTAGARARSLSRNYALSASQELSAARTNSSNLAREEAMARVRIEMVGGYRPQNLAVWSRARSQMGMLFCYESQLKAEAAAKERDAAMKAAAESASKVAEVSSFILTKVTSLAFAGAAHSMQANRLRDAALAAEAALKKKAEDAEKVAKEMEERLKHANNTAANYTREHENQIQAHEELKGIANGVDD